MTFIPVNYKAKKRIFLGLLLIIVFFLSLMTLSLFLFIKVPQTLTSLLVMLGITVPAALCIFLFLSGLLGIVFIIFQKRSFPGLNWFIEKTLFLLFPVVIQIGRLFHINRDHIQRSFLEVNNQLARSCKLSLAANELLLLLPHCLQNSACTHRITHDSSNCRRCGGCQIGALLKMASQKGIGVEIVTGGTLARRAVLKHSPKAVIAVACERDLCSGVLDTFPLPVIGVVNERPEGPCYNTRVDFSALEEALDFFLKNTPEKLT
jgi:hypothetical protein